MADEELLLSNAVEWRWVDTDGSQHRTGLADLRALLADRILPPFVLVWRPGWSEWLQAKYVPELASSLGDLADPQVPAPLELSATEPPRPALNAYVAAGQPLSKRLVEQVEPPPYGPAKRPRPEPIRDVLPTLMEEPQEPGATTTLRPAAALPPPPRDVFPSRTPSFDDVERTSDIHANLRFRPPDVDAAADRDSRVSTVPPRRERAAPSSAHPTLALAVVGAVALLIAAVIALNRFAGTPSKATVHDAAAGVVTSRSTASAATDPGCIIAIPAKQVAPRAFIGVPPILDSHHQAEGRVAVGFAAEATRAVGLLLTSSHLGFDQPFAQDHPVRITGVVPLPSRESLSFAIDGIESELAEQRTVSAESPFAIGVGSEGFSRRIGSSSTVVWQRTSADPKITIPRVVEAPGIGHLVVFRHGNRSGKMLTGWLTPAGEKLTELSAIPVDETILGTPSVTVAGQRAIVAFSAKRNAADAWSTRIAALPLGGAATQATRFEVPAGGPGHDVISASATPLPRGRLFLQWTEGARENRVVRGAVLNSELDVVSDPITLSPPGEESGQGVAWSDGERAVVLFFVKQQRNHELWGVSLKCP